MGGEGGGGGMTCDFIQGNCRELWRAKIIYYTIKL